MSEQRNSDEVTYPFLLLKEGRAEIIACAPMRHRLLWDGKPVAAFKFFTQAAKYMVLELID